MKNGFIHLDLQLRPMYHDAIFCYFRQVSLVTIYEKQTIFISMKTNHNSFIFYLQKNTNNKNYANITKNLQRFLYAILSIF